MRRLAAILLSAALLLAGCQTGEPESDAKPSGALYRCIGEPSYDPSAWAGIRRQAEADLESGGCRPGDTLPPIQAMVSREAGDPVRFRSVVLDDRCGLIEEYTQTVPAAATSMSPVRLWDARFPDGSPAPTGEYFINTEITWRDGRKDTTFQKVGYVNTLCPARQAPLRAASR